MSDLPMYEKRSSLSATLEIAKRAKLGSFAVDLFKELHGAGAAADPELARLQAMVDAANNELVQCITACGPLIDIVGISDDSIPEKLTELKNEGNFRMEHLAGAFGVTEEHVQQLYATAKARYDAGQYVGAHAYLSLYEELRYPKRDDVPLEVSWGKMAAALMANNMGEAEEERQCIAEALRRRPTSVLPDIQRLQQRTWLLHWSLFLLGGLPQKRDVLIDFYMQEENLMCVALTCPWLLRYVIAAVLPHRRFKHNYAKALVRLLTPEALALKDPFVSFLHALLVNFDFEAAQSVMKDCRDAIASDFFLNSMAETTFMASARGFLFDVYCRVHQKIDLRALASQVHMGEEDAEKWVVGLIRSAHLDAKVDSQAKTVEMLQAAPSLCVRGSDCARARAPPRESRKALNTTLLPPNPLASPRLRRHWQIAHRMQDMASRTRALFEQVSEAQAGGR